MQHSKACHKFLSFFRHLLLVTSLTLASFCQTSSGQGRIDTLISAGEPSPGGDGTISNLNNPAMSANWISFQGALPQINEGAIFSFNMSTGNLSELVRTDMVAPNGNGNFSQFFSYRPDPFGGLLFESALTGTVGGGNDNNGFFRSDGNTISAMVREGNPAPDGNGNFDGFSNESYSGFSPNANRVVRITCSDTSLGTDDNVTLFRISQSADMIFREGDSVPGGDGEFADSTQFCINRHDTILFHAALRNTLGGAGDNEALYLYDGSNITQMWREGLDISPDGNGEIGSLGGEVRLNAVDQALFRVFITNTSGGLDDNTGLVLLDNGVYTMVAREDSPFVGTNGVIRNISQRELADNGSIGFIASLRDTNGGNEDDRAVYLRHSNGVAFEVIREGDPAFDGNGVIGSDHVIRAMLAGGQMIYEPQLLLTAGGNSDNEALLVTDGIDTVQALRTGQVLGGEVLSNIDTTTASFNEQGQVAFIATLDGTRRLQLWTPDLHFRSAIPGSWSDPENWTLSFLPGDVHDVSIENGGDVDLAADATVRSLNFGNGMGEILTIRNSANLTVNESLALNGGTIHLNDGNVHCSSLIGHGNFSSSMGNGNATVHEFVSPGNPTDSTGTISFGNSSVDLQLSSTATTEIELGGTTSGEFDQLTGIDDLTINGNLNVSYSNGFSLTPGDHFLIFQAQQSVGTFEALPQGAKVASPGGVDLHISYVGGTGNDVILVAPSVLLGDINLDGVINLLDVAPFVDLLSNSGFQAEADTNLDGLFNLLDVEPFIQILSGT